MMGKVRQVLLGLVAGVPLSVAAAPPAADPFLARLVGHWELSGAVLGKPVTYRGEGRWVLDDGCLCLSLIDRHTPPQYQASVYLAFDAKAGDYVAHWLDRFGAAGARVVATGKRQGDTLVLSFPYADGAFGDTLVLPADGTRGSLLLESQQAGGGWSTFASYTLRRAAARQESRHGP